MPTIVNPMDALKTFEPALKRGELQVEPGRLDPSLIVHHDRPNGEMRMSYAKMNGSTVSALAIIIPADRHEGLPVFQIGYAVPQHLRKRGLAKSIAQSAMDEFTAGMAGAGIKHFFFEAVVGVKNIGSQKVAAHVIGGDPKEITDENSGEAALQYFVEVGSGENRPPAPS